MPRLQEIRAGKPGFYPDQSIYAEYACAEFALRFEELDRGTGLVFRVSSAGHSVSFGAGRGSFYPQHCHRGDARGRQILRPRCA